MSERHWKEIVAAYPQLTKNADSIPKSTGIIGMEIEVEGFVGPSTPYDNYFPYLWARAADGSLRNAGCEFISVPIQGQYIVVALNFLKEYLAYHKTAGYNPVTFSDLCGVHVHLNVRDFSVGQFANLLFLYMVFENSLMRIAGDRSRNIFCLPINVLTPALRSFLSRVDGKTLTDLVMGSSEETSKYAALNYVPVKKLGTVEFRHMEGNLNVPRLLHWVSAILRIRDFALDADYLNLKEKVFDLNTNSEYEKFGRAVFDKWFDKINNSTLWNEMAGGVRKLKTLTIPARDIYVADVNDPPKPKPPKVPEVDLPRPRRPERLEAGEMKFQVRVGRDEVAPPPHVQNAIDRIQKRQEDARIRRDNPPEQFLIPDAFIQLGKADQVFEWKADKMVIIDDVVPAPKPEGAF